MRNTLDRLIGGIAPGWGVRRAHARDILRAYDAAQIGKRATGFGKIGGSANVNIGDALGRLRDRASALVRNSGHGFAMLDVMVRNLVGAGIRPVFDTGSDPLDKAVRDEWDYFVGVADVEGVLNLYGLQELAVRGMVERGETLTQFVVLPLSDDRRNPLRLRVLEGDMIDTSRDGTVERRRTRLGVALGEHDFREGYWIFPEHPGERLAVVSSKFVPRDRARHLFRPMRPGQVRGMSWFAPVLMDAKDYRDLLQFTIVKAQVEASFAGYITNGGGAMASPIPSSTDAATGERIHMPEPGTLYNLKAGQEITFPDLSSSGQFDTVGMACLRAMAAGIGLTYDQATGDFRQSNYSSMRAGKIEHRRFVEVVQHNCLIPMLCRPVVEAFLIRSIMTRAIPDRPYPYSFVPPANEPIDPVKELSADIDAVRAGRMPPQEFAAQWGYDWRQVIADNAKFYEVADKAKVKFDIDGRAPKAGAPALPAKDATATEPDDDKQPADTPAKS